MKGPDLDSLSEFLARTEPLFRQTEAGFRQRGAGIATSLVEMSYLAAFLDLLSAQGGPPTALECGAFQGFSTCCLSWACHLREWHLYSADSFKGLPLTEEFSCFGGRYRAGDLKGTRQQVEKNLTSWGVSKSVTLVEGWYSESLRSWNRPLSLLWLDVDLASSATDVMNGVFGSLDRRGVILSHEIKSFMIHEGQLRHSQTSVALALHQFFSSRTIPYRAVHLVNDLALLVPNPERHWIFQSKDRPLERIARCIGPQLRPLGSRVREAKESLYRKAPFLLWLSRSIHEWLGWRTLDRYTLPEA